MKWIRSILSTVAVLVTIAIGINIAMWSSNVHAQSPSQGAIQSRRSAYTYTSRNFDLTFCQYVYSHGFEGFDELYAKPGLVCADGNLRLTINFVLPQSPLYSGNLNISATASVWGNDVPVRGSIQFDKGKFVSWAVAGAAVNAKGQTIKVISNSLYDYALLTDGSLGTTSAGVVLTNVGTWNTPAPKNLIPTLVDPVPALLSGAKITPYLEAKDAVGQSPYLANVSRGRLVQGIAADGVAQVVVRIPADFVGQKFLLNIANCDTCSTPPPECQTTSGKCVDRYGLIFDPTHPKPNLFPDDATGLTPMYGVLITAVQTSAGPMAFAAYRAPIDFVRDNAVDADKLLAARSVNISLSDRDSSYGPMYLGNFRVGVIRPPVILVHGLWATADELREVGSTLLNSSIFSASPADFGDSKNAITIYNVHPLNQSGKVSLASLGIRAGANFVSDYAKNKLKSFKQGGNILGIKTSVAQADLVGHSMGALISRSLAHFDPNFYIDDNFQQGYVHKIISVAGPHLGSPFASELLATSNGANRGAHNDCIRFLVNWKYPVIGVYGEKPTDCLTGTEQNCKSGAIADLSGSGDGNSLSTALQILRSGGKMKVAYLVGAMNGQEVEALAATNVGAVPVPAKTYPPKPYPVGDFFYEYGGSTYYRPSTNIDTLKLICSFPLYGDTLVEKLGKKYSNFMGGASDGIVPIASQGNGSLVVSDITVKSGGVVHSGGGVELGFGIIGDDSKSSGVMTLLDKDAADEVIRLLNTPLTNSIYQKGQ